MTRFLIAALFACCAALVASPAGAHAVLLTTSPSDREVLAASPEAITLRFNESVVPIAVRLLDENGVAVATDARLDAHDGDLRLTLSRPLTDGAYVFSYRITSEDSHPVSGTILFAVGAEPTTWRAAPPAKDDPFWAAANAMNRALHLASLLGLAGGMAFLLLFPGERLADRRLLAPYLTTCAALAAMTALFTVGLQGAVLANAAMRELISPKIWRLGFASTRGTAALTALSAAILLVTALRVGVSKAWRDLFLPLTLGGFALAVLSFVLSGHAATAQPRWMTVPALALHVAVAALWLGSFVPLLRAVRHRNKGSLPRISAFSRVMSWTVPVLMVCGALLAAVQLQSWNAFTDSRYGAILLVKLLLVAVLLSMAANNKFRLTPALRTGLVGAETRLMAAIRWEIAVGLAILAVTALLSQTVPPRSLGEHAGHDHSEALHGYSTVVTARAGRMALINVDPAVAGRNRLDVRFITSEGRPFSPLEVRATLGHELTGIDGLGRPLQKLGDGHYLLIGPEFALPGSWRLQIDALITDYEQDSFVAAIPIAR